MRLCDFVFGSNVPAEVTFRIAGVPCIMVLSETLLLPNVRFLSW